jgi:hypothetical protein
MRYDGSTASSRCDKVTLASSPTPLKRDVLMAISAISATSIIAYATQPSKIDVPGIQDQVVGRVIGRLTEL